MWSIYIRSEYDTEFVIRTRLLWWEPVSLCGDKVSLSVVDIPQALRWDDLHASAFCSLQSALPRSEVLPVLDMFTVVTMEQASFLALLDYAIESVIGFSDMGVISRRLGMHS